MIRSFTNRLLSRASRWFAPLGFGAAIVFAAGPASAYPNFIGYGYTTCITCHWNNHGHGGLNDYGRAIYAQEIAARPGIPKTTSDEELADKSGFIPGSELPYWLHPGLKYRGLWYDQNPHSDGEKKKWIDMQREINLAFQFDHAQKYVAVFSYDWLPMPMDLFHKGQQISSYFREEYFRWKASNHLYVLAGLFDQTYGLRIADHTAYSRAGIGLDQFSQTHGLTLQWVESAWDFAFQYQLGNQNYASDYQRKGIAMTGEYEIGEKHRLGGSFLVNEDAFTVERRIAIHDRWGLKNSPGSSLLWEAGILQDVEKSTRLTKTGDYEMAELLVKLWRGYNLLTSFEHLQAEIRGTSPESYRYTVGALTFPFPRTEARVSLSDEKKFTANTSSPDTWMLQGQLHVSY